MKKGYVIRFLAVLVLALALFSLSGVAAAADYTLSGAGTYWSAPKAGDPLLAPYTGGVPSPFVFSSFLTEFSDSTIFAGTGTIGYGGSFGPTSGWTASLLSSNVSLASGPSNTRPATWDYLFVGTAPSYPITFDVDYFLGAQFVGHEHYVVAGNGGPYTGGFNMTQHTSAVPIPPSIFLFGTGMLGIALARRRLT